VICASRTGFALGTLISSNEQDARLLRAQNGIFRDVDPGHRLKGDPTRKEAVLDRIADEDNVQITVAIGGGIDITRDRIVQGADDRALSHGVVAEEIVELDPACHDTDAARRSRLGLDDHLLDGHVA
jgi:hypothetical protein